MDQITRTAQAALSFCLPAIVLTATSVGQQLGPPQAYPQQQAYSAQAQPPANSQQPVGQQPQAGNPQQFGGQTQPVAPLTAGQPPVQPPAAAAPQMPPGFPLNALQQASLDAALDAWQRESNKIVTFSCPFDRLEYVMAFGPVINNQPAPLNKNKGDLSYSKPDKGSFQISEIYTYKTLPAPAGQQPAAQRGDWLRQPNAIGEHWVCDGKSVYEFRSDLNPKQVIERSLPPRAPGQAMLDGPLPFLFGAESAKLKERYWMRVDETQANSPKPDPNQIWLNAWPKYQQQAADFRQVDVILNRQRLLPQAMCVTLPNGDKHVYVFNIDKATVNGPLDRIQALFEKPHIPWGYKHVVENVPVAQGPQPGQQTPPR